MTKETAARWAEFKAKRARQYSRDAQIKFFLRDFFEALIIIGAGVIIWFTLACCYA